MDRNMMNDVHARMKACIRTAMAEHLEPGREDDKFCPDKFCLDKCCPMDEVKTVVQLEKCLDRIAETCNERLAEMPPMDEGYYLRESSVPSGHEIFVIGTIYVLLCAGARVWLDFDPEYEDKYYPLVLLKAFEKEFAQLHRIPEYEDLEEELVSLRREHNVVHAINMGDCCNMMYECGIYDDLGMRIHVPGAHVLVVDYSTDELPESEHRLLGKFGDMCFSERIDYSGYNGKGNRNKEYYGFDYGDLFWNHHSVFHTWKGFQRRDRLPVVLFTDKGQDADLPGDIEEYAQIYRPDEKMLDEPMYDFMQLLERARPEGWFREKAELVAYMNQWDGVTTSELFRKMDDYSGELLNEVMLDLDADIKRIGRRIDDSIGLLRQYADHLKDELKALTSETEEDE